MPPFVQVSEKYHSCKLKYGIKWRILNSWFTPCLRDRLVLYSRGTGLGAFVVQYDHKAKLRIIVQLHDVVSFCAMSLRESNLPFRGLSFWTNVQIPTETTRMHNPPSQNTLSSQAYNSVRLPRIFTIHQVAPLTFNAFDIWSDEQAKIKWGLQTFAERLL